LVIVCGPPASGKSTFVAAQASAADLVIDLDIIAARLSGAGLHGWSRRWLTPAVAERNALLHRLGRAPACGGAWLILTQPRAAHREWWSARLRPTRVVVLETPAAVCEARIMADPERTATARFTVRAVRTWWRQYEQRAGEHRIGAVAYPPSELDH
jgi:5-methylcytosine-specific restriction protein A